MKKKVVSRLDPAPLDPCIPAWASWRTPPTTACNLWGLLPLHTVTFTCPMTFALLLFLMVILIFDGSCWGASILRLGSPLLRTHRHLPPPPPWPLPHPACGTSSHRDVFQNLHLALLCPDVALLCPDVALLYFHHSYEHGPCRVHVLARCCTSHCCLCCCCCRLALVLLLILGPSSLGLPLWIG